MPYWPALKASLAKGRPCSRSATIETATPTSTAPANPQPSSRAKANASDMTKPSTGPWLPGTTIGISSLTSRHTANSQNASGARRIAAIPPPAASAPNRARPAMDTTA